jgi:hypothetical protein
VPPGRHCGADGFETSRGIPQAVRSADAAEEPRPQSRLRLIPAEVELPELSGRILSLFFLDPNRFVDLAKRGNRTLEQVRSGAGDPAFPKIPVTPRKRDKPCH